MKLSTKGRYATRAMLDLAQHYTEGPILVKEISKRKNISERYLEQILISLKTAGLVRGIRGARGGFVLIKSPSEINLSEIITAVEGSTALVDCVDDASLCPQSDQCVTREVWSEVKRATDEVLESISLQELVERQKMKEVYCTVNADELCFEGNYI
ncbi:MAG: Rrf2 family transcriptional regulator [Chloroflexota bacterium]|nr:Rrf2 family transcriptional regulator [Chloroflexota bacterium]